MNMNSSWDMFTCNLLPINDERDIKLLRPFDVTLYSCIEL